MEFHKNIPGIIELLLGCSRISQEASVQILLWLYTNVHGSVFSQCICMIKLSWELVNIFYLLATRAWHTNHIPCKELKYMSILILQVGGIQLILLMPTISIHELDSSFNMLAVPYFGKGSFKLRLHFQRLKLSILRYLKLWGRQFPWWIRWKRSM